MAHALVARVAAAEAQASRRADLSAVAEATLPLPGHTARLCAAVAAHASRRLPSSAHHQWPVECAAREDQQAARPGPLRLRARLLGSAVGKAASGNILCRLQFSWRQAARMRHDWR